MDGLSIVLGGDFGPTESNLELFKSTNVIELFGQALLAVLKQADFRVFNLENPLVDKETRLLNAD